ncbi:hypothetical protein QJS10_CPB21g01735 [Acorus calamus]|uniref:C2 domain-containing protein n=1 Tax=Acorus calamus TaxID=4465 RepID=A0AAV9C6G8_ACOCL|nr:hypothetical protein QJS10_CPB21g01735 [Acorus calamus]
MAKIRIEVCMISARGLHRSSSFLKPQWFAVGWIDPNNKYCSKIDNSGCLNPTWKTKFSFIVDDRISSPQGLTLTVEIYSRDPIFLREKLQGTATILLKEFLTKFAKHPEASRLEFEEVGSYQLRKRNSGKPQGFVDVSVKISEERERISSYSVNDEAVEPFDQRNEISLAIEDGRVVTYPTQHAPAPITGNHGQMGYPYYNPTPPPPPNNSYNSYVDERLGYHRPQTPPPPPPPSNVGFIPTFLPPGASNSHTGGSGFGTGLGEGALAAGAVIFGDDFMSGPNFQSGFGGVGLNVSTDPPF